MTTAVPTCLRCGYDLRLASADTACPECGLAVHRSIGDRVHPDDCPPAWVRRIAVGTLLLLVAYLLLPAGLLVAVVLSYFNANVNCVGLTLSAITMLCCSSHFAACLLLARDDSGRREMRWATLNRRLLGLSIVPFAWSILLLWTATAPALHVGWPPRWVGTFVHFAPMSFVILPSITFDRLRRLAIRLSRPRLAEHITIVTVGWASSPVACVAAVATLSIFDAGGLFGLTTALAVIGLFYLWGVALLLFVTPRFFESAAVARAKWRLADAARPLATT